MLRTHFTILCALALLLLPVAALSQYTPPGNPYLSGEEPCEDDFLIPTLGGSEVQVQPCPSNGTTPPAPGTTSGGGGGGGGSTAGGRRLTGNLVYKGRRLVPAAPHTPIPVTPLPEEKKEPVLVKPLWDPLRRPRIRRVIPGMPAIPSPAYEPAAPVHTAAPLPESGAPLGLLLAVSLGGASLSAIRKRHSPTSSL